MIDTSIKLLDKLIQFLKYRNDAEVKTFEKVVNPIFENLQVIHEDYLQVFEWCEHELEKGTEITIIAERLMKDRLEQEALRQSIIAFIEVFLKDERLSKYELFFRAARYYFWKSDFARNNRSTRSTMLLMAMRQWAAHSPKEGLLLFEDAEDAAEAREDLLEITQTSLEEIRRAWADISERYAELLTHPQSIMIRRS